LSADDVVDGVIVATVDVLVLLSSAADDAVGLLSSAADDTEGLVELALTGHFDDGTVRGS